MNFLTLILLAASLNVPDDAIRQLIITGGAQAERTLLAALPQSEGSNTIALIKALGDLRSAAVVPGCARLLPAATGDLKDVCLYALSRVATPQAGQLLKAGLPDTAAYYLRYGETLAGLGRAKELAPIAADLLKVKSPAVRCGALALLPSPPALLAALDDPDASVREQAVRELSRLPSPPDFVVAANAAKGQRRALLLDAFSRRADCKEMALFIENLDNEDELVRAAAAEALSRVGGIVATRALWARVERPEARDALALVRGDDVDAEIAKGLSAPATRVAALDLLAKRRARSQASAVLAQVGAEPKAALSALEVIAGNAELEQLIGMGIASGDDKLAKTITTIALRLTDREACVDKLLAAPADRREWALALLPVFGGKVALDAVVAAAKGENREAGVRALSDWRDSAAVEPLLALCRTGENEKVKVLAARGAVRVVEKSELSKADKIKLLEKIQEAAPREEEKQQAAAAIKRIEPKKRKEKK